MSEIVQPHAKALRSVSTPSSDFLSDKTRQIMRHHAKSFDWAARFLSPATRDDTRLLYAFARWADDLADEPALGALPERLATLAAIKNGVCGAQPSSNLLISAVVQLRQHHALPTCLFDCFLDSLIADAQPRCLQTEQELFTFAYGVAGVVGLMMRPLLGAPPAADLHALALGLAMQLTNIARDVVEDGASGRTYIPASWGVGGEELCHPKDAEGRRKAFAAIAKALSWAEAFYAFAEQGLAHIPMPNQRAIRIALALYRGIGRKILRLGPERYWQGRVQLSSFEKLQLTVPLLWRGQQPTRVDAVLAVPPQADVLEALYALSVLPGFPILFTS